MFMFICSPDTRQGAANVDWLCEMSAGGGEYLEKKRKGSRTVCDGNCVLKADCVGGIKG